MHSISLHLMQISVCIWFYLKFRSFSHPLGFQLSSRHALFGRLKKIFLFLKLWLNILVFIASKLLERNRCEDMNVYDKFGVQKTFGIVAKNLLIKRPLLEQADLVNELCSAARASLFSREPAGSSIA